MPNSDLLQAAALRYRQTVFRTAPAANHQLGRLRRAIALAKRGVSLAPLQAADRTPFLNELPESVRFSQATLPQLQWHEQPGEYWLSIGYRSDRKQRLSDNIRC